jgi:4-hydroxybenzoate polyprenyltransferase
MRLGFVIAIGAVALSVHLVAAYMVAGYAKQKGYSFLAFFLLGATATWMTSGAVAFTREDRRRRRADPPPS